MVDEELSVQGKKERGLVGGQGVIRVEGITRLQGGRERCGVGSRRSWQGAAALRERHMQGAREEKGGAWATLGRKKKGK
jgi:hypothetical protein